MRRGIVLLMFLAAAIISFAPANVSANPSGPCDDPSSATGSRDTPGTLNGTSGDDILFGSTGADVINGKGGNDIICGNGGADLIDGGTGSDTIEATDGSTIYGGIGNDALIGRNGSVVYGGAGNDQIVLDGAAAAYGESGNDQIENESGAPTVDCGSGSDVYWDYAGSIDSLPLGTGVSCENKVRYV